MTKPSSSKTGLTLVELLIVAGVLAILAAILFPTFHYVREKSRATSCLSNARQLGASILMYASDNDQRYPRSGALTDANWANSIQPYAKNTSIYLCPSATAEDFGGHQPDNSQGLFAVSYAYNCYIGGMLERGPDRDQGLSIAAIARPSSAVLLTEGGTTAKEGVPSAQWKNKRIYSVDASTLLADALTSGVITEEAAGPVAPKARHNGKASVTFADGHAKSLPIDAFFAAPDRKVLSDRIAGYSPCLDPNRGCIE